MYVALCIYQAGILSRKAKFSGANGDGKIFIFAFQLQEWQPYTADPYSYFAINDGHTPSNPALFKEKSEHT